MKRILFFLFALFMLNLFVNVFAQEANSTKLYMPTFSPSTSSSVEQVKKGHNFNLDFNKETFNGYRAGNRSQTLSKIDSPLKYPIFTPFLLVAKPTSGSNEVVWNINSKNVTVISTPMGSMFETSSHVRTPVLKQNQFVNVENPVIIKEGCPEIRSNWKGYANQSFSYKNLFTGDVREYCVDKSFNVPAGYSYILVKATMEDYVHFTAVSYTNGDVGYNAEVVGHVQFVPTPYVSGGCEFNLVISGKPVRAPLAIPEDKSVQFNLTIENRSDADIDLSQVALEVKALGIICGKEESLRPISWIDTYYNELGTGTLKKGENRDILLKEMAIDIDKIPCNAGVLKARASILYPTSGETKYVELDVSFTKDEKPIELAGIGTKLSGRSLYIINPAESDANRKLKINSVNGNRIDQLISAQDGIRLDEPAGSTIKINYSLYLNGATLGNYTLDIKK